MTVLERKMSREPCHAGDWECGCVCLCVFRQAFELATGDYLFEPHSGDDYSRDEGMWSIYVW